MLQVIHANWSAGALHLWSEDADAHASASTAPAGEVAAEGVIDHPFAGPVDAMVLPATMRGIASSWTGELALRLPCAGSVPTPSRALERLQGGASEGEDEPGDGVDFEDPTTPMGDSAPVGPSTAVEATAHVEQRVELRTVRVRTLRVPAEHALEALVWLGDTLLDGVSGSRAVASSSLEYWSLCARFARFLLAQQRFVPMLVQLVSGELKGAWRPWLSDEAMAGRAALLVGAMPPAARAAVDAHEHEAWAVTEDFLGAVVDAACRSALTAEDFGATIEGRDATQDPHVAWLASLLTRSDDLQGPIALRQDIAKRVRVWIGALEERGASSAWRLLLRLAEPDTLGMALDASPSPDEPAWTISFHLQSLDPGAVVVDASDIWLLKGETASILGRRLDQPQELLLKELGRASRLYKRLEIALASSQPSELRLNTRQAYEFLREVRPVLIEQGVGVESPPWWDSPAARVGAKLMLESDEAMDPRLAGGGLSSAGKSQLGLATLVNYTWEISVGDTTLSLQEFEQLAARRVPLVRVNGRWVEIRPEDVHAAIKFIRENPGGRIRLSEAMRLAYASEVRTTGIPVVGLEATGWVQGFMSSEAATRQLEMLPPPREFRGTLRPYQARGVSWMMFQERLGFGICLADDMGLGKTVQLLALLAYEREGAGEGGDGALAQPLVPDPMGEPAQREASRGAPSQGGGGAGAGEEPVQEAKIGTILPHGVSPTLLLVPMSVVGNWQAETKRFCPHLTVLVHHGAERAQGEAFFEAASRADLVITTYSLAHRDREMLGRIAWGRIVLDEAQYIKNPASKQSQAARGFEAGHRVALTGTPVENRLSELWSIMDFLNPGYLGGAQSFRSRFAVPIERYHDKHKGEQLRGLIRPFVLRRLKSDPTIIADLPAKLETREFAHLTGEQASLYESCVKRMLSDVDASEGIQRRGLVLAALIKLKQICNHPSQALKDWDDASARPPDPARSAKCVRLLEMLDEVIAEGEQSLIFTQFRTMGRMLEIMLRQRFGKDVLFIHGGTPQAKRVLMVEQFQRGGSDKPVLLLSLRAGGVGLNLTAATHVFHFDRWWNPAVENQATDRAYRIGQTRTVQVHKFVVKGTLEERIDQMIESKSELAENIIGQGEQWLSELSTDQLRDILTLRNDAIDDLEGM